MIEVEGAVVCEVHPASRFYRRWLALAFKRSWGIAETSATVVGVVVAAWQHFHPRPSEAVNSLVWQAPLYVLVTLGFLRLALAPYWMYREVVGERDAARADLTDEISEVKYPIEERRPILKLRLREITDTSSARIRTLESDYERALERIEELQNESDIVKHLTAFVTRGEILIRRGVATQQLQEWMNEARCWRDDVHVFLTMHCTSVEAKEFVDARDIDGAIELNTEVSMTTQRIRNSSTGDALITVRAHWIALHKIRDQRTTG